LTSEAPSPVRKKNNFSDVATSKLAKAVLDVFCFFFITRRKENDECNLLAFTCVKNSLPCPPPQNYGKFLKNSKLKKITGSSPLSHTQF